MGYDFIDEKAIKSIGEYIIYDFDGYGHVEPNRLKEHNVNVIKINDKHIKFEYTCNFWGHSKIELGEEVIIK